MRLKDELRVYCSRCRALPGDPCRTKTGGRATWPHSDRIRAVNRLWLIGYKEGIEYALDYPALARRDLARWDG